MGISKNGAAIRNLLISQEYISHPMTFDCPISPIKDYDDYWLNYNGYDLRSTTCTINGAHLLQ
jgi:hypothetical protein